jgi:hypothetical protein
MSQKNLNRAKSDLLGTSIRQHLRLIYIFLYKVAQYFSIIHGDVRFGDNEC